MSRHVNAMSRHLPRHFEPRAQTASVGLILKKVSAAEANRRQRRQRPFGGRCECVGEPYVNHRDEASALSRVNACVDSPYPHRRMWSRVGALSESGAQKIQLQE